MTDMIQNLKDIVLNFDIDNAEAMAKAAINSGLAPVLAANALTDAIRDVGDRFGKGELYLPDLVCASEVLKKAFPIINEAIEAGGSSQSSLGKVVIGTVFGDIHSIGKSMVATLLYAAGFKVIDLGIDVDYSVFVDAIKQYKPDIVAFSGLLTTTLANIPEHIKAIEDAGLRKSVALAVGGAPVTQHFADMYGIEIYAPDASSAAKEFIKVMGAKQ